MAVELTRHLAGSAASQQAAQAHRDHLAQVGMALFGAEWVSPMARELSVALRTLQRWAAGAVPVPPKVLDHDVPELVRRLGPARLAELEGTVEILRRMLEDAERLADQAG